MLNYTYFETRYPPGYFSPNADFDSTIPNTHTSSNSSNRWVTILLVVAFGILAFELIKYNNDKNKTK